VTDFLEEKRREIDAQLANLKPAVDEYARLEAAADALAVIPPPPSNGASPAPPRRRRGPGRPPGSKSKVSGTATASRPAKAKAAAKPAAKRKAGRRKGGGERSLQALRIITAQPGIPIPEIAGKMGIKQNYLYRVLPGLGAEGKVEKKGRGWHPKAQG
jgi:anti-sigma factor RsiW